MNAPSVFKLPGNAPGPASAPHDVANTLPDQRADVHPAPPPTPAARRPAAAALPPATRNAFVPVLMMALALVAWFGAQLWDGYQQRQQLLAAHQSQQQTVDNASKLRQSLDALAADTQRMADGGNANAALLVTELRKRGITISVPGAAAPAAPPAAQK